MNDMTLPAVIAEDLLPIVPDRPPFNAGIYTADQLSNEDYHRTDALSASGIKTLLQSPMHYKYQRDNPTEPTPSMLMGTALHMMVLEPDKVADSIIMSPDTDEEGVPKRPTKPQLAMPVKTPAAAKAIQFWGDFERRAAGKLVLTPSLYDRATHMAEAVKRHPIYAEMVDGQPELSFMWRDARSQTPCKCRYDYLRPDGIAFDLKSCVDASPEEFARSVASFRYHIQNAWYDNGHTHVKNESLRAFIFIAVESVAPYAVAVYVLEPNAIRFGYNRCEEALLLYDQAVKTGWWRGYPETVQPLQLPKWATTLVQTR